MCRTLDVWLGGSQDSETEAGSAEAGSLSQVGEGFDGAFVRSETTPKDDGTHSLQVSDACTKAVRPAARCPHCPPLFASFRRSGGSYLLLSRQQISGAVKRAINLVQSDSGSFSGISMRRGCNSQAIHARVPEPILYLQSGHGSGFAARTYIVPEDPRVLHETAQALRL